MDTTQEKIAKPIVGKPAPKPTPLPALQEVPSNDVSKKKGSKLETPESEKQELSDEDVARLVPQENYLDSRLFYEVANYFGVEERQYSQAKNYLGEIVD